MSNVLGFLGYPHSRTAAGESVFADWQCGWYHNSAAAAIDETGVLAAVEEERFSRRKNTGVFPSEAIAYCLSRMPRRPDLVAFGEAGGYGQLRDPAISVDAVRSLLDSECGIDTSDTEVVLVDHHTSHAYSAAIPSGFDDALVATFDGFGDGISGSLRMLRNGVLEPPHREIPFSGSLGRFYSSTLSYLGYRDGDEYKVMGLAPFGDPSRLAAVIADFYSLAEEGEFTVFDHDQEAMYQRLRKLGKERRPGDPFTSHHADVAAAFQDALENIVLHVLRYETRQAGARKTCFAGGVAHNSSMIGRLQRELRWDDLFVQPAADDSGIALGAAYAGLAAAGVKPARGLRDVFLGPDIDDADVAAATGKWADWITVEHVHDPVEVTARLLAEGAVVGVARGRMEFGPRALGNRSILADPRLPENKDRVNRLVKSRESFRPFAPAVPEEAAPMYFDLDLPAASYRFMTAVTRVREAFRPVLPAVTHIDGSARVQTVAESVCPFFHAVLKRFGRITGVPVLLNTSLNNHREPIVATADDALVFLLTSGIDCVVLGDGHVVRRTSDRTRAELLRNACFRLRPGAFAAVADHREGKVLEVVGPERRHVRVGEAAFTVLTRHGSDQPPAEALDDLFRLWVERFVDLLPGQPRSLRLP